MIISVNWLKKFVPDLPEIDELSKLIGARLVEIESIENLNEKYKDVVIARVISAKKVEGSDHLNLCKIDDGGKRDGVQRDENGFTREETAELIRRIGEVRNNEAVRHDFSLQKD